MTNMITVTRLYTQGKGSKAVKRQKFMIAADAIESIRPSSKMKGQKSTIVSRSGMVIPVAETIAVVDAARKAAFPASLPASTARRF